MSTQHQQLMTRYIAQLQLQLNSKSQLQLRLLVVRGVNPGVNLDAHLFYATAARSVHHLPVLHQPYR